MVDALAAARIGATFNFYAEGARAALLRARLAAYLEERAEAPLLLVGEAPGYRGTRVSGIPLTSERQLTGSGRAEATATIVHRVLAELGLAQHVLLWNVVPTHPHRPASPTRTVRRPRRRSPPPGRSSTRSPAAGGSSPSGASRSASSALLPSATPRTVEPRPSAPD